MTTRSEREKAQKLNEQHQAILSKLLREEDNKYCADCEAKGPRWASWNLGVFICIRCAGIHRNLGVHISRVKSVNLDQWTSEQIQSIQDMGNTKARKLYEANLPETFRRPQTDQAVEFFIRDKYEKKKYYSEKVTNGSSPKDAKKERDTERGSRASSYSKSEESRPVPKTSPAKPTEPSVNLLSLDAPTAASANNGSTSTNQSNNDLDIFGPMVSNPLPASTSAAQFTQVSSSNMVSTPTQAVGGASTASGQGDLDLFSDTSSANKTDDTGKKPLSKDSILSLYGTNSMPQQAAPAGMFMSPSQMQFPVQAAPGYQAFAGMGAAMPSTTVMGAMMAQSGAAMMGPSPGMMVGMTMPNGLMGNTPATGVMGIAPRMMGPQSGPMPAGMMPAQGMYAMQPGQQAQWNMGQVNQQMSGLTLNGGQMAFSQPPSAMGGWAAAGSGQTLSTQLWK
ncbi:stromal membrane-associated protein 1-like [Takifugu rubripes]|uniref:Small ArfGAP 1 n=2 Tax=Takifugu TaxID=31032 RepID=H2UNH6_TAKRU|nr:stromal membrane-associated protein 1-like [Takifugu rubripes]XP_056893050.1 stromal membrane-associated protein 1-like [Takifugu flavidus]|eukprot:XP_011611351.1 PREDICTED: stromal membrane-associated protein 1-like [Takifugu rubripes]